MPSPTSSTRPVSRTSSLSPMSAICRPMIDVISLALSFNDIAASGHQLIAESLQAGTHGGVVDLVADLNDQPAEQLGIGAKVQDGRFVKRFGKRFANLVLLGFGQRHGGAH